MSQPQKAQSRLIIAQDHDDELEDAQRTRNPRDWPFPTFEPVGPRATAHQQQALATARRQLRALHDAPVVVALTAPATPDRAAWKTCSTLRHNALPELDKRAQLHVQPQQQQQQHPPTSSRQFHAAVPASISADERSHPSPNAFLLQQSRPRWVSMAQQKTVSRAQGCPSRGIPVTLTEDPSVTAARVSGDLAGRRRSHRRRGVSGGGVGGSRESSSSPQAAVHHDQHQQQAQPHTARSSAAADPSASAADPYAHRSVEQLLRRVDAMSAGTRNHLPREAKALSFLKESTRARVEIKRVIACVVVAGGGGDGGGEGGGAAAARAAPSMIDLLAPQGMLISGRHAKQRSVRLAASGNGVTWAGAAQRAESMIDGSETFEDLTKPLAVHSRGESQQHSPELAASFSTGQIPPLNESAARSPLREFSGGVANDGKMLVRLPKVGLQLFALSQRRS